VPPRLRSERERGFGLLLVVVTLALMGVLAFGAFGVARREWRNAADLGYAAQAFEAAEAGLAVAEAVAAASAGAPLMVPQPGPGIADARTRFTTAIVRVNESLLLVTSVGERLDGGGGVLARRKLGLVGKIVPALDSLSARFQPLEARGWVQLYD
jgi:hypothetical protein